MHKFIFAGPTISWHDIKKEYEFLKINKLESIKDIEKLDNKNAFDINILPPVSGGDLYSFRNFTYPVSIGIIDGYFENTVAVLHKEILFLLNKGHRIMGSSSMGALRAAELSIFGMLGIGRIFHNFYTNIYEDDDEVTVAHGPEELGYPQVSEAMANIRFTLARALSDNVITENVFIKFISVSKSTFYKKRNYGGVIRECISNHNLKESDFSNFIEWLQTNRVDQKKIDALELIDKILQDSPQENKSIPLNFEDSLMWRNSIGI